MTHPFLSDEWIAAARSIYDEYREAAPAIEHPVRMNLVVRDVPFGPGEIEAHADTSSGELVLDLGHLDAPDATLTLDYETAREMLVDQDPQAGMQAFLNGRIAVDGDLARLILLQAQLAVSNPVAEEVAARIRAVTAP
jgi:hypothetical protein